MAKKPSRKDMPKFVIERPPGPKTYIEWWKKHAAPRIKEAGGDVEAELARVKSLLLSPSPPSQEEQNAKIKETREQLRRRFQRLWSDLPYGRDPAFTISVEFDLDEARELAFLAVDATIELPKCERKLAEADRLLSAAGEAYRKDPKHPRAVLRALGLTTGKRGPVYDQDIIVGVFVAGCSVPSPESFRTERDKADVLCEVAETYWCGDTMKEVRACRSRLVDWRKEIQAERAELELRPDDPEAQERLASLPPGDFEIPNLESLADAHSRRHPIRHF